MKKILFLGLIFSALSSLKGTENLPSPYDTVDLLPFDGHGWYANGNTMETLIKKTNPKVVIEVGSWLGLSTRHIARTLPDDGVVYAVDHWNGTPNEDNSAYDIPNLYRQFLSNVIHENLTHKIIPIRMDSVDAARTLKIQPDLIYLDASHDFTSVLQDLTHWYPLVKGRGTLCGDDYYGAAHLGYPVKRAVDLFAKENNLTIYTDGWMWWADIRL